MMKRNVCLYAQNVRRFLYWQDFYFWISGFLFEVFGTGFYTRFLYGFFIDTDSRFFIWIFILGFLYG